ncbi:MAG TPA: hypothetical protein DEF00_05190 [Candidatus Taylorbacteria bacterium]|nr:MAG: hypothetical protein UY03_C0015G0005 [Parcubacteria group bacterium GW2011_GWA2_47_64]KKU97238.1 MAG: hypothetical protein UY29_C0001G0032 [Parcubacteria group bacterium GW2011_GWC2_48_17]HBV01742.1 hypothetical protein [Candidatus Taylorbacteria bacterium]
MSLEDKFLRPCETSEQFPSKEEITRVFETILQGQNYRELRIVSNETEVSLYEIEVLLENGEKLEYNYQKATYDYRNKALPPGAQFSASIHKIRYDAEGVPYSGECVANYLDGKWEYVSQ